ncbi:MAG: transglycosylase SLT domain-containing protein [bacterium]
MSSGYSLHALRGDATQLWATQPVPKNVTDPETYKAARGFEAYFARYLINQLKGDTDMIGGKGYGGEIYQEMYVESLGSQIASTGALGITEMIYRQMMTKRGQDPYKESDQKLNPLEPANQHVAMSIADRPSVSAKMARYYHHVREAADRYGLEPELIYAVMQQESGGDTNAVSKSGAKGLMQLMDTTASDMGVDDSFNPRENILGGAKYLKEQLDRYGDLDTALAAYNAGPGAVERYGGIPPYEETRKYVRNVAAIYERIKNAVIQRADKKAEEGDVRDSSDTGISQSANVSDQGGEG